MPILPFFLIFATSLYYDGFTGLLQIQNKLASFVNHGGFAYNKIKLGSRLIFTYYLHARITRSSNHSFRAQ